MKAQQSPGPWTRIRGAAQRNQDLLRNAGSLAATTGLTSVFGFVYWFVAAHEFSPTVVGYGAAAVSAMTLLGTIGMFGLGTVLIGELPQRRDGRAGLMAAAIIASGLGSLVLGLGFPLVARLFGARLPEIGGTPLRLAVFAVGVAVTGATLVFDEGTIGLLRGGVQLSRNLATSVVKLIVLPVTALVLHDSFGLDIVLAWVIGTIVSLIPAAVMLARSGARIFARPDWGLLRRLRRVALAHNWLNLAITTPPKLIPVLVTVVVSPKANGAFYVAWMLASFLFMVPTHLSTVLFAIASASPELIAEKLRFVLRLSLLVGLPVMAVLAVSAHFALGLFGANYAVLATVPLWTLILGYIPGLPKTQYIAVCRATGQVTRAALVLTVCAGAELGAVIIGGKVDGLDGLSFAYLSVMLVEGIVTAPTVLRAAYARSQAGTGSLPTVPAAALASLATAAVAEGHRLDVATEVWRTGELPAVGTARARYQAAATAETKIDLLGGQPADVPAERLSYRYRQQAGLDVLIGLATPQPRYNEARESAAAGAGPSDTGTARPGTRRSRV